MSDGIAIKLLEHLQCCDDASKGADVDLKTYIDCWEDLKNILDAMGSVFRFVSSDVDDKGKNILLLCLKRL
jgi:hypothetical protein